MNKLLDENKQLVQTKTKEFQQTLQSRIAKFIADLEFYKRKVDQLEENGNIDKIEKYSHTANSLDQRLVNICNLKNRTPALDVTVKLSAPGRGNKNVCAIY